MLLQCSAVRRGATYRMKTKNTKVVTCSWGKGVCSVLASSNDCAQRGRPLANEDHHYCVQSVRIGVCVVPSAAIERRKRGRSRGVFSRVGSPVIFWWKSCP